MIFIIDNSLPPPPPHCPGVPLTRCWVHWFWLVFSSSSPLSLASTATRSSMCLTTVRTSNSRWGGASMLHANPLKTNYGVKCYQDLTGKTALSEAYPLRNNWMTHMEISSSKLWSPPWTWPLPMTPPWAMTMTTTFPRHPTGMILSRHWTVIVASADTPCFISNNAPSLTLQPR